jgi:hypothetical protein
MMCLFQLAFVDFIIADALYARQGVVFDEG